MPVFSVRAKHSRDVALIDDLLALPAETAWVEFKHENSNPETIGRRVAALSNAARVEAQDTAYMVWGVEDGTHAIRGTRFEPDEARVRGQPLALWLAQNLQPSLAFTFRAVAHPQGRLVLLEIPAAPGAPVCFQNISYIRIGSATPKLTDYPDRFQQLIERLRPYRWESEVAQAYADADEVLTLLDYPPPLFQPEDSAMRVVLYGPRTFAEMTPDERVRACYFHAVLKFLSGGKMKNATLCARLGIAARNASQATHVINKTLALGLIRAADADHPRAGYVPHWA